MPKGYVIGRAKVSDATKWAGYAAKASEVMKIYGGTPIVSLSFFDHLRYSSSTLPMPSRPAIWIEPMARTARSARCETSCF